MKQQKVNNYRGIDATGFDQEEALAEEKSQKQIARDMMAMVGRINRNYYPK